MTLITLVKVAGPQVCVIEKAMNTAEKILERAHSLGNKASVNSFVYAKLIQGYCSSDQRKEAFALLAVCPTYVSLLSAEVYV